MNRALDQWQQSVKSLYADAVRSAHNSNFYRDVLLACALAEVDEQRYFTHSAVRAPLSMVRGSVASRRFYARALRDLSEPGRGRILHRVGEGFRQRYRLFNPILRPYIIMRGVREKLISKAALDRDPPPNVEFETESVL